MARQNQHKKEIALLSEGKDREKRLIEYRKTAEDRKNYFESMERHMFASKTSVKVSKHHLQKSTVINTLIRQMTEEAAYEVFCA